MKLIVLCGPPGSGKSNYATKLAGFCRISQDDQGRKGHLELFNQAIAEKRNITVDRIGFNKGQRARYIDPARKAGYEIEIVILHVPRETCFERIMRRENHPTINGERTIKIDGAAFDTVYSQEEKERQANSALDTFFNGYERVEDSEADVVKRLGWAEHTGKTKPAIICDLDSTLCHIDHRLHHVKHERKKDNRWDLFFKEIPNDGINKWCKAILDHMCHNYPIILCSGRPDSTRKDTVENLEKHDVKKGISYRHLFMRHRNDFRRDDVIKEVILDFEILPRFQILMCIDDRQQVVDMYRRRGFTVLQCAPGDF